MQLKNEKLRTSSPLFLVYLAERKYNRKKKFFLLSERGIFMKKISLSAPVVVLMRGLHGAGKSTWLREHGVEDYVISPDEFRLILSPPVRDKAGNLGINQDVSKRAWEMAYTALSSRLAWNCGATFFDATFMNKKTLKELLSKVTKAKRSLISQLIKPVEVIVIDFSERPITTVKAQNRRREGTIRFVPESVIDRMWETGQKMNLADYPVKVYSPDEVEIVA